MTPSGKVRLFIAVDVDEKIRAAASALVGELAKTKADVKWTAPENLHLTLSFLGDTDEERLDDIQRAMQETTNGNGPLEVEFDRMGAFGAPSRPRVIWLGISTGAKVLSKLAYALQSELKKNGIATGDEPGREFSAHLTLGRVRGLRGIKALVEPLHSIKVPGGLSCRVDKLRLYQSKLSSTGPKYAVLRESALGI